MSSLVSQQKAAGWAALLVAGFLLPGIAGAQSQGQSSQPPAQTATEVNDQEINQFAAALHTLQEIKKGYSQKLNQAGETAKAKQIQAQMQQKMRQAIQEEGLTLKRYSEIAKAMNRDQGLAQKIQKALDKQG